MVLNSRVGAAFSPGAAELESANAMVHNTLRSVLEELYRAFRDSGEATFGNWFFQNGGFHHFVHFVYVYSVLSSKP